jgi:hypothetical protein
MPIAPAVGTGGGKNGAGTEIGRERKGRAMNVRMSAIGVSVLAIAMVSCQSALGQPKPEIVKYEPFVWRSERPADCPFEPSKDLTGIRFLGLESGFLYGDTWYPSWAQDDKLYSPWTDGDCWRLDGSLEESSSGKGDGRFAETGQAVIEGSDPLELTVYSLGLRVSSALPYHGRYPCGSLVHKGIWYYGTYCLDPAGRAPYGPITVNWPWLGPFVGFRVSTDLGRSWKETPHTPADPLFGETGINGYPVKIGSPHFVDFGKDMRHSPDGKAYLVAHGAAPTDPKWRFWNSSWITGDEIYLLRVTPSPETMNDASKYEFYAGRDARGKPVWTNDFSKIKPLLEWNNAMGCVTVTYDAPLKKFLMFVTDGGNTCARMNTYLLESDAVTGPWRLVCYMKDFGEQAYFVNVPSKFISADGRTMWLLCSTNFADDWNGQKIGVNPPGGHYGLVLQKIELLGPR